MNNEKIALIALVIIIAGALSLFLVSSYGGDILTNLFDDTDTQTPSQGDNIIEEGDCADVHYIGRYATNNTVFDSSYDNVDEKTGGSPLNIFITTNKSIQPPTGYSNYSSGYVEGLLTRLIGTEEGETYTFEIPPEEAYGVEMQVGDVIELTKEDVGQDLELELYEIRYDASTDSLPKELQQIVSGNVTDIYILRQNYKVGERLTLYPTWENKTVITKINETKAWFETRPSEENLTNFTWKEATFTGSVISYWENASNAVINEENNSIIVTHSPNIGDVMTWQAGQQFVQYTVVSLNATKINCSYTNPQSGNVDYQEFDRVNTLKYNQSENITVMYPKSLMSQFLSYVNQIIPIDYSLHQLAGETLIFEVSVENVYDTSKDQE